MRSLGTNTIKIFLQKYLWIFIYEYIKYHENNFTKTNRDLGWKRSSWQKYCQGKKKKKLPQQKYRQFPTAEVNFEGCCGTPYLAVKKDEQLESICTKNCLCDRK